MFWCRIWCEEVAVMPEMVQGVTFKVYCVVKRARVQIPLTAFLCAQKKKVMLKKHSSVETLHSWFFWIRWNRKENKLKIKCAKFKLFVAVER